MKRLLVLGAAALLAACAGTSFDWSQARQIQPGMTEAEVTKVMGKPYSVTSSAKGLIWVWAYTGSFSGTRTMSVVFRDGKVVSAPVIPESFK
jgi:SmpA / OmlA family